jgi:hypothetical protein
MLPQFAPRPKSRRAGTDIKKSIFLRGLPLSYSFYTRRVFGKIQLYRRKTL